MTRVEESQALIHQTLNGVTSDVPLLRTMPFDCISVVTIRIY